MPDNICSVILAGDIICKCHLIFLKSSSYSHTWGLSHNCCLLLYNNNFNSCCKVFPYWLCFPCMYVCTSHLSHKWFNSVLNKALNRPMFIFSKIPEIEPWTTSVQSVLWKGLVKDWKMLNLSGGSLACDSSGQICFQLPSMHCLEKLCASCTAICRVRSRARSNELCAVPSSVIKQLFASSVGQA